MGLSGIVNQNRLAFSHAIAFQKYVWIRGCTYQLAILLVSRDMIARCIQEGFWENQNPTEDLTTLASLHKNIKKTALSSQTWRYLSRWISNSLNYSPYRASSTRIILPVQKIRYAVHWIHEDDLNLQLFVNTWCFNARDRSSFSAFPNFSFPKLQLPQTSAFPNWLLAEAGLCGQEGRMFLEEPNPSAARRDQMGDQPLPRWTEKLGTKIGETKPSCSMVLEYLPTCSPKTTQM